MVCVATAVVRLALSLLSDDTTAPDWAKVRLAAALLAKNGACDVRRDIWMAATVLSPEIPKLIKWLVQWPHRYIYLQVPDPAIA